MREGKGKERGREGMREGKGRERGKEGRKCVGRGREE